MKINYRIEGMHCEACIEKIKTALVPHVNIVTITFNPPRLQIEAKTLPSLDTLNTYIISAGKYRLHLIKSGVEQPVSTIPESTAPQEGLRAYFPIFLIAAYILGTTFISNFHDGQVHWSGWMNQFMAGFFLVFSAFKLLNIKGFAEGYATYDWLARKWYFYGFIYPFLELSLGVLYLGAWLPNITLVATVVIMGFSSLGVIESLLKKQKIRCACLGTVLNVPLSSITLIEDLTMVFLASLGLFMY